MKKQKPDTGVSSMLRYLVLIYALFLLYGCGGGGGGGGGNIAPVAEAGADLNVEPEIQVGLDGSGSTDADGFIETYQWLQVNGVQVTLNNPETATPDFVSPDLNGSTFQELIFRLTVTDNKGAKQSDTVTVRVEPPNKAPVANAGDNRTVNELDTVVLDGGASSDSDGSIDSYFWEQIQGPAVSLNDNTVEQPQFTAPDLDSRQELVFRLTVTDDDGATDSDTVSITVNLLPTADAGSDVTAAGGDNVQLDGSASSDTDGSIADILWVQTAGPQVTLVDADTYTPGFTAPSSTGTLTFELTVVDNDGAQQSDTVSVYVVNSLFSDTFENAANWTTVDESGDTSNWQVVNGEFYQNNYVETISSGNPFRESYHVGTYAWLSSQGGGWSDFRFSVEITPLTDNDDSIPEGNDVGVMFRYSDQNNYYRLSISSRYGFTRLEKRVSGNFTTLGVNAVGYIDDQTLTVTVEAMDDLIAVWVDGDPLFGAMDSSVASGTVALYCQDKAKFDNVLIYENSPKPEIVLASPTAYSIASTQKSSVDLSVSAIALNMPAGGSVMFSLDDTTTVLSTDSQNPYSAQFSKVSSGNHTIEAVLRDADQIELERDTNDTVGTGGDYYIAVGDSITNGEVDNYADDNMSEDGRIFAIQGYQANLSDLLTASRQYPHIVFNEGIGGDASDDILTKRLDSILVRHPVANHALVLLGTNDAIAASPTPVNTYKNNMQGIVDAINSSGKTPWIAKVPPIFNADGTPATEPEDPPRNPTIQAYNDALKTLTNANEGPDFYEFFLGSGVNRSSLYHDETSDPRDEIHPNALGHVIMAHLWHNVLTGADPLQLPFGILDNLLPLEYKQNLLEVGDHFYLDESYKLTSIPAEIATGIWVMTKNADYANTSASFITFDIDRSYRIYIAYKTGATPPSWMSAYTATGLTVTTDDAGVFTLYSKLFSSSGTVSLGGNHQAPGDADSMYLVIAVEQ